jgi:hypothetical protein
MNISDCDNQVIRKITTKGMVETVAGRPGILGKLDGRVEEAIFNSPIALCFDHLQNLLVVDCRNHCIRKISPDGYVSTFAGCLGTAGNRDGSILHAMFDTPMGMERDIYGNIYIADSGNCSIRKISNGMVTTITPKDSGYYIPTGIAVVGIYLYFADFSKLRRIQLDVSWTPGNSDWSL